MNLKQKKSVIKKISFLLFIVFLSINTNAQDTVKVYIHDTIERYVNVEKVLNNYKREIKDLKIKNNQLNNKNSELKERQNEYSQNITPLITEVSNTISHIISVTTDETSLETINSIITIVNYLSLLDNKNQLSNKISKLEKYKEEFQIVNSAHLLLDNLYNKEKNDESINKLKNLNLSGKRNTEKIKILSLLEEYCRMNNKIASLFTKVDGLSSTADKENQLYKGTNYRYTRNYPFLYQELQKKKDNLKYRSKVKEVNCD